jgi:calcium/calmodulin-dependent protein kinase I
LAKYFIPRDTQTPMFTACGTPSYVAPEIIFGRGYDFKVDCWSLGVILYVMLCGFPPFYDDDNAKLFELIKDCQFDFPSPYWDNVSEEAKDLIRKLLVIDSDKRLSAEQILQHPWLSGNRYSNQALQFDYQKYKASKLVFLS